MNELWRMAFTEDSPAIGLESVNVYAMRHVKDESVGLRFFFEEELSMSSPSSTARSKCQVFHIHSRNREWKEKASNKKCPPVCSWDTSGPTQLPQYTVFPFSFLYHLTTGATITLILHILHFYQPRTFTSYHYFWLYSRRGHSLLWWLYSEQ